MKILKRNRCDWASTDPIMVKYHDTEWGRPIHSDKQHFEFLILEAAQAGLSWSIVLKKRQGYKKAFSGFDPKKVAKYTSKKINQLVKNPEIIRNRLKIEAAVNNAKKFLEVQKEFGSFNNYCWQFVGGKPIDGKRKSMKDIPATSLESDAFSLDLKKRGFKFVGSTVIYAHMQAVGMVNDHIKKCFCYKNIKQ
ncbi:MAG: DNA-3-methyladenine glycosylase I [Oligoflexia bacterium]|nr:DNA-3-methyladenine glycosylase I [Oligoflexia bacterium]